MSEVAKRVMKLDDDDGACEFFAQPTADGKGWALFIKSSVVMNSEDVCEALDVFLAEAITNELDLMGAPAFTTDDH